LWKKVLTDCFQKLADEIGGVRVGNGARISNDGCESGTEETLALETVVSVKVCRYVFFLFGTTVGMSLMDCL
jgi:hypothetical protein